METIWTNLNSTILFVVTLSILIVVHEWGHFITAKRLGIAVERFALGFGPTIYSRIHNGTRYMINIIPLGGYVKMAGDERAQCSGRPDEFYSKSAGHRALVVFNGPVVNFIFAYVCLFVVFMAGYPDLSNKIGTVLEGYPAQIAGLAVGDQILQVNGQTTESWSSLQQAITTSTGDHIQLQIVRDGRRIDKTITPRAEMSKSVFGKYRKARLVGIRPAEDIITLKYNPAVALLKAGQELGKITGMTYKAIFAMLTGSMSVKENVTGPIGIFYILQKAAEMGMSHVLFIMGVISASLAIFNLLPVIPLDGGHLFLLGIEKLRGRALSARTDEYIARAGVGLIIFLALFVLYSDFSRFGFIDKIKQWLP
ncbi:MAG TPA: RIP metalloprotease RseP [Candidatus Omnitrophica bacterium]|nr:MAG: RIP metalloprotease RseP [Omnitrophica WOR_2 bacterium GWA2_53_43]HBO97332.1 RIP metalloprotease RseP [Candidatus Omnitrophota bacterium]HCI45408.1 RIP metalloprotease RseP [Candidatus Omnitrophota bacterium]